MASKEEEKRRVMASELITTKEYRDWLVEIKKRIQSAQLKAATAVNTALLEFYWSLGADIVEKQKNAAWGSGFLKQLSKDLIAEFPNMKGFSLNNLQYIKRWYFFYCDDLPNCGTARSTIGQQPVATLTRIPWGHNLAIISKCDSVKPTIGILLCKGKDKVVAEYALSDIHKPMGVSEYELTRALPDNLKSSLPTIEQIEAELQQGDAHGE